MLNVQDAPQAPPSIRHSVDAHPEPVPLDGSLQPGVAVTEFKLVNALMPPQVLPGSLVSTRKLKGEFVALAVFVAASRAVTKAS